jgi:hypothetical protein
LSSNEEPISESAVTKHEFDLESAWTNVIRKADRVELALEKLEKAREITDKQLRVQMRV